MKILISVEQAISLVLKNVNPCSKTEIIDLEYALGYVLAEPVMAPINLPPFRQAAMDGYAVNYQGNSDFKVVGEVKAGDAQSPLLEAGQCVRIFTGAQVPDTANVVIKQEAVIRIDSSISVEEEIKLGSNIRPEGEQIKKSTVALGKGATLNASAIGLLASLGLTSVTVFKKPNVGIVVTGNELVSGGQPLKTGQIYESNAVMLNSALASLGIFQVEMLRVADNFQDTALILSQALDRYDFTLVSGGISVGDYDFVGPALNAIGVTQVFYKVKQKPGQPIFFGKKGDNFVFALPGNPASSLSCFYIYVTLAIEQFSHKPYSTVKKDKRVVENSFTKTGSRAHFLKACIKEEAVEILDGQASSMLHSFALANALVYLPEEVDSVKPGEIVTVWHLPN